MEQLRKFLDQKKKYETITVIESIVTDAKYFYTYHGKKQSYLGFIYQHQYDSICQVFIDENENVNVTHINIKFQQIENILGESYSFEKPIRDFFLLGELIIDMYDNNIFLVEDIIFDNSVEIDFKTRTQVIDVILGEGQYYQTNIDPFIVQTKILYNYEPQFLEIFFKTILINLNMDMDGIKVYNSKGINIDYIVCKNRVNLDMEKLEIFCKSIPKFVICNHINDFIEKRKVYNRKTTYRHGDKEYFWTIQSNIPDIYYLYDNSELNGEYEYALIPSIELSQKMTHLFSKSLSIKEKSQSIYCLYSYHEYHNKWIPILK